MIKIWRGNSHAEIYGPSEFLRSIYYHLAVPIEDGTKKGRRFGGLFQYTNTEGERQYYGSLLHGNRVAAGLVWHVQQLAQHYGQQSEVHDIRERPPDQYPWFAVKGVGWRPYQDGAHREILRHGVGVVDAPPRSGKTLMAARAIDVIAVPTLYLAPSLPIVKQTYDVFCSIWGKEFVARLDGAATPEEKDISKPIVVATAASAVKQSKEWFDTRQMLAIDEFHHAAAETYHAINEKASNAYYRICWTGTHFRTGDDRMAMEAIASHVLYKIPVSYLVENAYLARPRVRFVNVTSGKRSTSSKWQHVYRRGIILNTERNQKIARIADVLGNHNGIQTLVLVKRREHADLLGEMIPGARVAKGGEHALTSRTIKEFREGTVPILVGTTVVGEGVDVPSAGALVYAAGGGAGVQMMQGYFRPLTFQPGKETGYIYDFRDIFHRRMHAHSTSRFRFVRDYLGQGNVELL